MPIIAKDEAPDRLKPTPGMVDAVCVFVVDIGKHKTTGIYGDKIQHKIVVCWEIDEKIPSGDYIGKPFMVSRQYTFTLFEKGNLSKMLESWMAKKIPDEKRKTGIDVEAFIGKRCTLNLIESEDGRYVNVDAVLPANKANAMVAVCTEIPVWIKKLQDAQIKIIATNSPSRQPGDDFEPCPDEPPPDFGNQNSLPF